MEVSRAIVLMGLQASGKSTFYRQRFTDCVHINLDTLHTRNKEQLLLQECLEAGRPFAVDNTNLTAADRAVYIRAAREYGYRVEGYFLQSVLADCMERNRSRTGKARVPDVALLGSCRRLELPSAEEGFDRLYFVRTEKGTFTVEPWREG